MYAIYVCYLAILALLLYFICGRLLARCLEIIARKLFKLEIEISRAHFLALSDIKVTSGTTRIQLENIVLRTKWSFPDATHFMMLCCGHVTVHVTKPTPKEQENKGPDNIKSVKKKPKQGINNHTKLANVARFFAKYLGVYIKSLDIVLYDHPQPQFNLNLQVIKGIKILFKPNESFLSYSITTTKFISQLHQVKKIDSDFVQDVTLAEISFNVLVQGAVNPAKSPDMLEELSVKVNPLQISIGDNFIKNIPLLHTTSDEQLSLTEGEHKDTKKENTLIKYLPKHFDVTFTEADLYICDQEQRELSIHMDKLMCTAAQEKGPSPGQPAIFKTMVQLIGYKIQARKSINFVSLNKLMITAKSEQAKEDVMHISSTFYLESCHCNYVHQEMSFWAAFFVMKKKETATVKKTSFFQSINDLCKKVTFENDLEIIDLTATLSEGATNGKTQSICQAVVASFVSNIVLPATDILQEDLQRTIKCSARLENSYIYFNEPRSLDVNVGLLLKDNPSVLPSSRKHLWGRVLELGSFSLKCDVEIIDSRPSPQAITMKCDASSLVVEYSQHTKHCLTTLLNTGEAFKTFRSRSTTAEPASDTVKPVIECEFTVHDINVFSVGKCPDGIDSVAARLDVASLTKCKDSRITVSLHGCKVGRLQDLKKEAFNCEKSSELSRFMFSVTSLVTDIDSKINKINLPKIMVQWDPASHMALHDGITGIVEDLKELRDIVDDRPKTSGPSVSTTSTASNVQFEITLQEVDVVMRTSSECSFGVQFSGVIKLGQGLIMAESPNISICFDEIPIFQFKTFSLQRLASIADVTALRENVDGMESTINKLWILNTEVHILFPYRFNFAKSLDKFLIVNKMLKQLHRKPRSDLSIKEPLYADVWVKLPKVSFEIEDDPFEVKLGKNYELLLDEALQWIEREFLLEQRINEVRKKPGNLLTDKKVEGLYYSLSENKSKIYIERSVKLYEQDKRTRLCCWEFTDVNLMILADESMNGKDNIVPKMMTIDNVSPFPSEDIQFSTLWCRYVQGTIASSTLNNVWSNFALKFDVRAFYETVRSNRYGFFTLRDYEQPLFFCESFDISGNLIGAEQISAERAQRTCAVEICQPWGDVTITRGMQPLKYYHDLTFDFEKLEMTWGVDFEPSYTMVSIAFEHINKASVDPSVSLPFWDKMRLLLHGRLLMNIKEWQLNWRATRNPYDKSETLEVEWRDVKFDWTNACFQIFGDFDLFTRTASKYDDCCVLHLPALKFRTDLEWECNGDANNHYNIRPCAPDKVPELSLGQSHDSYAAFRSQNLSLNVSFEVEADKLKDSDVPTILLYATTFRWFQNFQAVVWRNVSRPIKKGAIFNRIIPKREPLSRHYRNVGLNLKFPQLRLFYWGSFSKNLGAELSLGTGSLNTVYKAGLLEFNDGLIRRPAANWSIIKLDSEIDDVVGYVTGIEDRGQQQTEEGENKDENVEPSKFFLGHVDRLVYKRKELETSTEQTESHQMSPPDEEYTHNLVCQNFRGVWTLTNRKLSFGIVDTYTRSQQLKRDLSADALKSVKVEKKTDVVVDTVPEINVKLDTTIPVSNNQTMLDELVSKTFGGEDREDEPDGSISFSPPRPRSTTSDQLLDQLVSETSYKFYIKTEEHKTDETQSSGYNLCNSDDVLEERWHIEFINSQVMLKGIENAGCLLVTAGNAKVLNRLHRPTQTGTKLLNKNTWVGHLENMQYFCTVRASDISKDDIPWLDASVITSRRTKTMQDLDLSNLTQSRDPVGGMVGNIVSSSATQLQRIVSKCGCQFFYASFDSELEPGVETVTILEKPSPSRSSSLRVNKTSGDPVNTFTLKHPILEISINSAQYALILDIVSNVLLYTEPQKKEVSDLEQRMSFYFQLSNEEDLKGTILNVQNNVRGALMGLNELRRGLYNINELLKEKEIEQDDGSLQEMEELKVAQLQMESDVSETKANLNELSTELRIMISAYKDFQTNRVLLSPEKGRREELMKVVEVYLDHVTWRLTQPDGQLQIVDANLNNLRYTNITMTNASGAHSVEVGNFQMTNLLPNSPYKKVITPRGERRVGKDVAVRVYCRVKSPVGGIGVKEHFEVNLCPLDVGLTYKLYTLMMGYFFPGRAHEYVSESGDVDLGFGAFAPGASTGRAMSHPNLVVESADKDVFHEKDEDHAVSQKPSRPNTLVIPDNEGPRARLSTASLDSPLSSLPSPLGTDKEILNEHRQKTKCSAVRKIPAQRKPGRSRFYASLSETASKELDTMKERASQTNKFFYVKIPEIPICFSYKGEKEKNLVDVHNFRLNLPTLQYQNRTWTWLDLMMAVKKDYKQVLVGQVIKEKLHWKGGENKEAKISEAEDKAKILFGDKQSGTRKKKKKGLFKKFGLKSKTDKTDAVAFHSDPVKVGTSYETLTKEGEEDFQDPPRSSDEEETTTVPK